MPAVAFATADFNGDGRTDVAGLTGTNVTVGLTTAAGVIGAPLPVATGSGNYESIAAADVTGDGKADLVINDTTLNALVVLRGHGDGTFAPAVSTSTTIRPNELAIGDFTGDQKADIAFYNNSGLILAVWSGNNTGTFQQTSSVTTAAALNELAAGDFDGDDKLDLFTHSSIASVSRVYRGNGDGTFEAPVDYTTTYNVTEIQLEDLDGDQDPDIVFTPSLGKEVMVRLNSGGTLAAPVKYPTASTKYSRAPTGLSLGDVTHDGIPDITAADDGADVVITLVGKGDGSFHPAALSHNFTSPTFTSVANLQGGGDLIVASPNFGTVIAIANTCGDTTVEASTPTPVITSGTTATISVTVRARAYGEDTPTAPTGTLSARVGTTTYPATVASTDYLWWTLAISGLPLGTHAVVIDYSGDDEYSPNSSEPVTVRVTTETTTARLVPQETSAEMYYQIGVTTEVTASGGGTPAGSITLYRDGVFHSTSNDFDIGIIEYVPGTYSYQVRFNGSATHPPSPLSAPVKLTFTRRASYIQGPGDVTMREGQPTPFTYSVTSSGSVKLYVDEILVAAKTVVDNGGGTTVEFQLTLSRGTHRIAARYSGNDEYLPAETASVATVLPDRVVALDVSAVNGTVQVTFASSAPAPRVYLFRLLGAVWSEVHLRTSTAPSFSFTYQVPNLTPGTAYVYRADVYDAGGTFLASSNIDAALLATFTDDPLVAQVTKVKAAHITQLVTGINAYRAAFGLGAIAPIANAAPGKVIKAQDLLALRYAIIDLRALTGAPDLDFDTITAKTTPIRARDIQQLRDSLR
jgi:hypothetical protein